MTDVQHQYWEGFNHPYKMLEKHYCEASWNLVKNNKVSVWGSFEPVSISEIIDWNIDPFDNDTWSANWDSLKREGWYTFGERDDVHPYGKPNRTMFESPLLTQTFNTRESEVNPLEEDFWIGTIDDGNTALCLFIPYSNEDTYHHMFNPTEPIVSDSDMDIAALECCRWGLQNETQGTFSEPYINLPGIDK